MPMIAFEYGARYTKRADFKSDVAKYVAAKVISSSKPAVQAAGKAMRSSAAPVAAGAQRALATIARPAAQSAAQGVRYMRPFARILGGAAIGSTLGGLGGAYRGYTHDRREPLIGAISQGLAGALGGGLLGGLTGSVVNPAFRV